MSDKQVFKYEVITDHLDRYDKGDIIVRPKGEDYYDHEDNLWPPIFGETLSKDTVENTPEFFKKIEKEHQYEEGDWVRVDFLDGTKVRKVVKRNPSRGAVTYEVTDDHPNTTSTTKISEFRIRRKATTDEVRKHLTSIARLLYDDPNTLVNCLYTTRDWGRLDFDGMWTHDNIEFGDFFTEKLFVRAKGTEKRMMIYEDGEWADSKPIRPHVEINTHKANFDWLHKGMVEVGCEDVSVEVFKNLYEYAEHYDLQIARKGSNINKEIAQIAQYIEENESQ